MRVNCGFLGLIVTVFAACGGRFSLGDLGGGRAGAGTAQASGGATSGGGSSASAGAAVAGAGGAVGTSTATGGMGGGLGALARIACGTANNANGCDPHTEACDLANNRCLACPCTPDTAQPMGYCVFDASSKNKIDCVQCLTDADCTNEQGVAYLSRSACRNGLCVQPCTSDANCTDSPTHDTVCVAGQCGTCRDDSQCGEGMLCGPPNTLLFAFRCLQCLTDAQCPTGLTCGGGACYDASKYIPPGCLVDAHCVGQGANVRCINGQCGECRDDSQCSNGTHCRLPNTAFAFECMPCATDAHCPAGQTCEGNGYCTPRSTGLGAPGGDGDAGLK
jgi:Cys-rich repeat protein